MDADDPTFCIPLDPEQEQGPPRPVPPEVPGYLLDQLLGRGSFGEVWKGVQRRSGQTVAVKLLTQADRLDWSYFRLEVRSLGQVAEHPNVVTLLDANLDHKPAYFAMAYLPANLTSRCGTTSAQAAAWMEQLALALRHMHARGLIHCDLKPSNIMVDNDERVRLADFGQSVQQGSSAHRLGSLGYMAPEQTDSQALPDVSWDIYGLGACTYFLLTGSRPRLDSETLSQLTNMPDGQARLNRYRQLLTERPSIRLGSGVDRDLADLVASCLALDPRRRPASADEVLQDLDRRRRKLPLLCRRPWSPAYKLGRFLKRRALGVAVAALFGAGLIASMGLLWSSQQQAVREAATRQFEKGWALLDQGETAQALLWWTSAANLVPQEEAFRFPLSRCPCRLANMFELSGRVSQLTFTPDGSGLLAGTEDGEFSLWDWRTGQTRLSRQVSSSPHELPLAPPQAVALAPHGDLILAAGPAGAAELWKTSDGSHRPLAQGRWRQGEFSADGSLVLLVGKDQAQVWRVADLTAATPPLAMPGVQTGRLAPDGSSLVLAAPDQLACWEIARPDQPFRVSIRPGMRGTVCMAYHPDGHRLAVVSASGVVRFRSLPDLAPLDPPLPYPPALSTALSPDGTHQAVGCMDGSIHLLTRGKPCGVVNHLAMGPRSARLTTGLGLLFSPDGKQLLGWPGDGSARLFDSFTGLPSSPTLRHADTVWCASFSPDGQQLATGSISGAVDVWQLGECNPTPHTSVARLGSGGGYDSLIFIPETNRIFTVIGNVCQIWDSHSGAPVGPPLPAPVAVFNYSQDGTTLATGGPQGVYLWDTATGRCLRAELGPHDPRCVPVLDYSGKRVALVTWPLESVPVYEVSSARLVAQIPFHDFRSLVFHPGGAQAALIGPRGVGIWDFARGQLVNFYQHHLGLTQGRYVNGADLLLLSIDGTTRLFRADGRAESSALAMNGPPSSPPIPDSSGRWIALPIGRKAVRVLDRRSGQPVLPDLPDQVAAAFERDGHLLTANSDGEVSRWDIVPDAAIPPEGLWRQAQLWTGLRLKPSGIVEPLTPSEWRELQQTGK